MVQEGRDLFAGRSCRQDFVVLGEDASVPRMCSWKQKEGWKDQVIMCGARGDGVSWSGQRECRKLQVKVLIY